jgi:hypothetical protein
MNINVVKENGDNNINNEISFASLAGKKKQAANHIGSRNEVTRQLY